MKVGELKTICGLVNTGGLIDEFTINTDGHITGIDPAKTVVADIVYFNLELEKQVNLNNISGVLQAIGNFADDEPIEIKDNMLHIQLGYKFANIPMKVITDSTFKVPPLTDDDYEIITKEIDHNILNELSRYNSSIVVNEDYYLYADGNVLVFRAGETNEGNMGDKIGEVEKATSNEVMKIIGNVRECFKNIKTKANMKLAMRKLMLVECPTEKYLAKYYIAPRIE